MPLQHSERKILKLMGRGGSRSYFLKLIGKIRQNIPDVTVRTTLIVGFPQEEDTEFADMVEFVRKARFDRLGVFMYSKEEGSAARNLKGHVPKKIKEKRFREIMTAQSGISLEKNMKLIGRTFKALVDDREGTVAFARIFSQAPEIDGVVIVHDCDIEKGSFVNVKIEDAYDYDLKGLVVK